MGEWATKHTEKEEERIENFKLPSLSLSTWLTIFTTLKPQNHLIGESYVVQKHK